MQWVRSTLVFALLNAVVLSADQLCFDSAAPPFELFEILVSKGAMMRDETRSFIEGTRSGNDLERATTFYNRDDKQITEKQWNCLISSFRGRVDTSFVVGGDWSPWSSSFARSGQGFLSPSPRPYAEIEARLIAGDRGRAAAGLDWVALDYSAPLAAQVLGEVFPVQVRLGVEKELTYFVCAFRVECVRVSWLSFALLPKYLCRLRALMPFCRTALWERACASA